MSDDLLVSCRRTSRSISVTFRTSWTALVVTNVVSGAKYRSDAIYRIMCALIEIDLLTECQLNCSLWALVPGCLTQGSLMSPELLTCHFGYWLFKNCSIVLSMALMIAFLPVA